MKKKVLTQLMVALTTAAFCGVNTQATVIAYDAATDGTTAPAGMTFTPSGGELGLKTVAGFTGLGVTGGYSGAEIDVSQSLTIQFDSPQYVQSLAVAFLYDGPEFGDPKERAEIATDVYPSFYLTTISETSASWTGSGTVQYLSPANDAGGGVWLIANPFAGNVSQITLSAVELVAGYGQDSDFSLHSIQTASGASLPVPDGGTTLALLGLGLIGLASWFQGRR